MHIVIEEDNLEVVKYLISKGADLKLKNNDGDDALIIATKKGLHKVFVHLLSQGADLATTSPKTKRQPIHIAARYGDLGILDAIIDKGVDANQEAIYKEVPLHLAIKSLFLPSVKYLIEKGANINAKDKSGKTRLDITRKTSSRRIIDLLVKSGAKSADEL